MCDSDGCSDSAEMRPFGHDDADPIARAPSPGSAGISDEGGSLDCDQKMSEREEDDSQSQQIGMEFKIPVHKQKRWEHLEDQNHRRESRQSSPSRDGETFWNDGPHNQGPALVAGQQDGHQAGPQPTENAEALLGSMPDYHALNGKLLLGSGVQGTAPMFYHGCSDTSGWMSYSACGFAQTPFVPVRAMCFNVPAECFGLDASKFTDWQTPTSNSLRVASVAALLGMVYTPLSKGIK